MKMSSSSGKKMSFSQTCNLLSQFVREKRALCNNNNFDVRGAATMNLFPMKKEAEESNACVGKTINLFPQLSGINSSVNKRDSPEHPTPPLTIFYGGQVLIFNDLPADKAKEVMDLATSFEASLKKRKVETTNSSPPSPVAVPESAQNSNPNLILTQNSNHSLNVAPKFADNIISPVLPNVSDLPIARKASLHRFLEKRKDRLCANSPRMLSMEAKQSSPKASHG